LIWFNLMFFILPWLLISAVQLCPPIHNLLVYLVTTLAVTIFCFIIICPLMIGLVFTISPLQTLLLISSNRWSLML
jgi:hypothetical protein